MDILLIALIVGLVLLLLVFGYGWLFVNESRRKPEKIDPSAAGASSAWGPTTTHGRHIR